jgi:hypothetical protein
MQYCKIISKGVPAVRSAISSANTYRAAQTPVVCIPSTLAAKQIDAREQNQPHHLQRRHCFWLPAFMILAAKSAFILPVKQDPMVNRDMV